MNTSDTTSAIQTLASLALKKNCVLATAESCTGGLIAAAHGAVSEATVIAMAEGAVARSDASVAVSVSGVAGPSGGSAEKPVGTVWIACAGDGFAAVANHFVFSGNRQSVRQQAVDCAVRLLISCIDSEPL